MPLAPASIIGIQGSSPRHEGTKMVVDETGKSYGTIGGETPEEITVSIVAELISERDKKKTWHRRPWPRSCNAKAAPLKLKENSKPSSAARSKKSYPHRFLITPKR
ncbi:MAG: XdhC family protein [Deltaproteobacteria bacterium]|nr:XdhC family protein [Deltaproteobacteria bacterium]